MKVKLFGASSSQGQDFRELVFDSDENSAQFLHQAVSDLFNLAPNEFVLVSTAGVKVDLGSNIRNGQTLRICPTVRGGKGGFGSLLRAFGKQMQQSTNKEACRDLSGRRIRHVNNEKKLKEFVERQEELAAERELKKSEKAKRRKQKRERLEHSHHLFVDPQYDRQKEKIANDLDEAITKALGQKQQKEATNEEGSTSGSDSEEEGPTTSGITASTSKEKEVDSMEKGKSSNEKSTKDTLYGDWMGCGDLDVSSSSSTDDSDQEKAQPAKKKLKN